MPRSKQFRPGREPHEDDPGLQLHRSHVSGPFSFLNPTWALYATGPGGTADQPPEKQTPAARPEHIEHIWRSRDNRKGRHALRVDYRVSPQETGYTPPPPTTTFKAVAQGVLRMITYVPYWDVSYLVATSFTLGSVIWIINAFFVWLPLQSPSSMFPGEGLYGGGITAFIGATVFEIGSVLLLLEAVNANQTGCFGWALETVLTEVESDVSRSMTEVKPSMDDCLHHHANRNNIVGAGKPIPHHHTHVATNGYVTSSDGRSFRWMPSLTELRAHYLHELGFLASLIQFIAATIFWIAGFTALPGIFNHMSHGVSIGVFWVPQIVGGVGFIASGLLFTLETQEKWYKPAFHVLGWYIGAWNFIGGIGFTLSGALGLASTGNSGVLFETTLATFWGSWAFMIGSTIQWYESLQKHPVERKREESDVEESRLKPDLV